MNMNKKGMGLVISLGILIIVGILVFSFAVIIMKKVTDYGKNLTQSDIDIEEDNPIHWDPDYMKGASVEEKILMVQNLTISPNELAG